MEMNPITKLTLVLLGVVIVTSPFVGWTPILLVIGMCIVGPSLARALCAPKQTE